MHCRQALHDYLTATMLMSVALFMALAFCCAGCATQMRSASAAAVSGPGGTGNRLVRVSESKKEEDDAKTDLP
jgi:hypothetical protein